MRLTIEIAAAALLVVCISATSAAFAAGRAPMALSCSFQCRARRFARGALCSDQAAVWRKFYANYCGDKLPVERRRLVLTTHHSAVRAFALLCKPGVAEIELLQQLEMQGGR
jgi:hypothetical protein